ncbi:MAG: hypothetical protein ACREVL_01970 [Solimonas sp.]
MILRINRPGLRAQPGVQPAMVFVNASLPRELNAADAAPRARPITRVPYGRPL